MASENIGTTGPAAGSKEAKRGGDCKRVCWKFSFLFLQIRRRSDISLLHLRSSSYPELSSLSSLISRTVTCHPSVNDTDRQTAANQLVDEPALAVFCGTTRDGCLGVVV